MPETLVRSTRDVIEFLTNQHNLIKDMFDEVLLASGNAAREQAFAELRQLLAVHETAEEMVVHPRARRDLAGGDAIVDARLAEEHAATEQVAALEQMDVCSSEFVDAVSRLRDAVLKHAVQEEDEEFAKLQAELTGDELRRMAGALRAAEAIAPTRPHPGVESATLNFAVGPFATMLDRARDAISAAIDSQ